MASPDQPLALHASAPFVVDTLVEAILDAPDPSVLTIEGRPLFRGKTVGTLVVIRMHAAQWELSLDGWARVAGEVARRSRARSLHQPSLARAMDMLMDGGMAAIRTAQAAALRGAH